jgi:MATE family multidrug resistance protein
MASLVLRLLRLAWPVSLSRLGIMGMGVCDAVMVGQLAPHELAHQALGWAPTQVMLVSGIGLLTGVQVLAARGLGAGKPEQAGGAWQRGLVVSAIAGVFAAAVAWLLGARIYTFFGVAPELAEPAARLMRILSFSVPLHLAYITTAYLVEALQRPLASTVIMWLANIVNLAINLWLVPQYGALGSAWATFGARLFLAIGLATWVLCLKDAPRLGLRQRQAAPGYREFLRVGGAAALSQAAEAGAFSGMTMIAGRLGAAAIASYQIMLNLLSVVFMIALGMSSATAVLASEAIGREQPAAAARVGWTGLWVNTGLMSCIAVLVVTFAHAIARAYTVDTQLVLIVAGLMPLAAAAMAADGGQVVVAGALRAQRDNWFPTASHVFAYAFVMPFLGFMLAETRRHGVAGLLEAIIGASIVSVGVLMSRLWVLTQRHIAAQPGVA